MFSLTLLFVSVTGFIALGHGWLSLDYLRCVLIAQSAMDLQIYKKGLLDKSNLGCSVQAFGQIDGIAQRNHGWINLIGPHSKLGEESASISGGRKLIRESKIDLFSGGECVVDSFFNGLAGLAGTLLNPTK